MVVITTLYLINVQTNTLVKWFSFIYFSYLGATVSDQTVVQYHQVGNAVLTFPFLSARIIKVNLSASTHTHLLGGTVMLNTAVPSHYFPVSQSVFSLDK